MMMTTMTTMVMTIKAASTTHAERLIPLGHLPQGCHPAMAEELLAKSAARALSAGRRRGSGAWKHGECPRGRLPGGAHAWPLW